MNEDGRLAGGWMSGSRLVDGTIRRRTGAHTPFVHALLRFLDAAGFEGAPRVLGIEGDEEQLSYVEGHVPVETAPDEISPVVFSDSGIRSAFVLIRRYHDVTTGCPLVGRHEVVCHGDLSPWNTVYDERGAVAFIDWDNARPGERSDDVGYAVWRHLMLGFPAAPPLDVQRRQLRLVAEAYGRWQPHELLDLVAEAQRVQHGAFHAALVAGDDRIKRIVELGALDYIEGAQAWLAERRNDLLR